MTERYEPKYEARRSRECKIRREGRERASEQACEIEGEGESERGGSLIHFNELPV